MRTANPARDTAAWCSGSDLIGDQGKRKWEADVVLPQRLSFRRQRASGGQGHRRARGAASSGWSCGRSNGRGAHACCRSDCSGTIPNVGGRIIAPTNTSSGGSGGPTGVIGTNKKDAQDTVDNLIKNLGNAKEAPSARAFRKTGRPGGRWLAARQPSWSRRPTAGDQMPELRRRAARASPGQLASLAELLRIGLG